MQRNTSDIKQQQLAINELVATAARHENELAHQRELAEKEREILALRVENILLKSCIPPPAPNQNAEADRTELERAIAEIRLQLAAIQSQIPPPPDES